jgi:hypothetical protein
MTRRQLLLLFPALVWADEWQEIVDWVGKWVQRLTEENASEFGAELRGGFLHQRTGDRRGGQWANGATRLVFVAEAA